MSQINAIAFDGVGVLIKFDRSKDLRKEVLKVCGSTLNLLKKF